MKPGQIIRASDFNELERRISACENLSGYAPIEVSNNSIRLTNQKIFAQITGVSGSAYSWQQVTQNNGGLWTVTTNGYVGTLNAYEFNGTVTPTNSIVELVNVFTNEWRFFYFANSASGSITLAMVTNVCDTLSAGVVTSVTVEYTPVTIQGMVSVGSAVCVSNPGVCCSPAVEGCSLCPGGLVPYQWEVQFSGITDTSPPCNGGFTSFGTCAEVYANSFTLTLVNGEDCAWQSGIAICNEGVFGSPSLSYIFGQWYVFLTGLTLTNSHNGLTLNNPGGAAFNCLGINNFTGTVSSSGICTGTTINAVIVPA